MDILARSTTAAGGFAAEPLNGLQLQSLTGAPGSRALGVATLISWLVTAGLGGYMLRTWIARGGLRRSRATGEGPPPTVIFAHFGLAVTGLVLWAAFVLTGWSPLAWAGGVLLMPVVGLGISTLTLWTPYPTARPRPAAPGPAPAGSQAPGADAGTAGAAPAGQGGPADGAAGVPEVADGPGAAITRGMLGTPAENMLASRLTDDIWARALTDEVLAGRLADMVLANVGPGPSEEPRRSRGHLAALIPVGHGFAALATVLLTMLAVVATV